jgi:activating signal cointegrator 1
VETRSWRTDYRGDLAIHAAVQIRNPEHGMRDQPFFVGPWHVLPSIARMVRDESRVDLLGGVVLAVCKLADVVPIRWKFERALPGDRPYVSVAGNIRDQTDVVLHRYMGHVDLDLSSQAPYGDFRPGRYAWLLADIRPLDHPVVPPPGNHQRLWNLDPATLSPSDTTVA